MQSDLKSEADFMQAPFQVQQNTQVRRLSGGFCSCVRRLFLPAVEHHRPNRGFIVFNPIPTRKARLGEAHSSARPKAAEAVHGIHKDTVGKLTIHDAASQKAKVRATNSGI